LTKAEGLSATVTATSMSCRLRRCPT